MYTYAQTNIQLYAQLAEQGYSSSDMLLIRQGYELAVKAFSGRFEQSGKVFIAHAVGVASILASLGADAEVVTAGIVHNIYRSGDFGFGADGITTEKRRLVADRLGGRVEKLLHYFARWTRKFGRTDDETGYLESADKEHNDVVLISIADQLDKILDNEILYFSDYEARLEDMGRKVPRLAEASRKLGYPQLAGEIESRFERASVMPVDPVLRSDSSERFSEVVMPASGVERWRRRIGRFVHPRIFSIRRLAAAARARLRA
jgi:(p)ppGpp synthase/HD superfamily hydrolase